MDRCCGVILSVLTFKESDRIATLFSPAGIVKFIAKRAGAAWINVLIEGEFLFTAGKSELLKYRDGSILNQHLRLRERLENIEAAGKLVQAILKSQWPGKAAPHLYQLFCYCLTRLPEVERPQDIVTLFLVKTLKYEGLLQLTPSCSLCSKEGLRRYGGERFCEEHAPLLALKLTKEEEQELLFLAEGRSLKEMLAKPMTLNASYLFDQAFA